MATSNHASTQFEGLRYGVVFQVCSPIATKNGPLAAKERKAPLEMKKQAPPEPIHMDQLATFEVGQTNGSEWEAYAGVVARFLVYNRLNTVYPL